MPHSPISIIHYRMCDVITLNCCQYVCRVLLIVKFGTVNSNLTSQYKIIVIIMPPQNFYRSRCHLQKLEAMMEIEKRLDICYYDDVTKEDKMGRICRKHKEKFLSGKLQERNFGRPRNRWNIGKETGGKY